MIYLIRVHLTAAAVYLPACLATTWLFPPNSGLAMPLGTLYGCAGMLFALKRENAL